MRKAKRILQGLMLAFPVFLTACEQMMDPTQQGQMIHMPFGGLFMILILIAIVVFISLVLKGVTRGDRSGDSPLEIIKRRYASGEIDKDQYERMKKELTED